MKARHYKIIFVLKLDTHKKFTWSTLEIALVYAMAEYANIFLENSTLENIYIFMH